MPASHPYLTQPLLYVHDLPLDLTDADIAELLKECLPVRLHINRDEVNPENGTCSGSIEFRNLSRAEKALTTLTSVLPLSPYAPPESATPMPASADSLPRLLHGFSEDTTLGEMWEVLQPRSCRKIELMEQAPGEPIRALVEFWFEDDARQLEAFPPRTAGGRHISIITYNPSRRRHVSVPRSTPEPQENQEIEGHTALSKSARQRHRRKAKQREAAELETSDFQTSDFQASDSQDSSLQCSLPPHMTHLSKPTLGAEVSGWDTGNSGWGAETSEQDAGNSGWGSETAGQEKKNKKKKERSGWVAQEEPEEREAESSSAGHDLPPHLQPPPMQTSNSSGQTESDPRKVYVGNLDPSITSNDLFEHFRNQVRCLKAEVESGKGFGFVWFHTAMQAQSSIGPLNGQKLGSKKIVVQSEMPTSDARAAVPKPDRVASVETSKASRARQEGEVEEKTSGDGGWGQEKSSGDGWGEENTLETTQALYTLKLQSPSAAGVPADLPSPASVTPSKVPPASNSERDRLFAAISPLVTPPNDSLAGRITTMILTLKKSERALCLFNKDFLAGRVTEASDVLAAMGDDSEEEENAHHTSLNGSTSAATIQLGQPLTPVVSQPSSSSASLQPQRKSLGEIAAMTIKHALLYLRTHGDSVDGLEPVDQAKAAEMDAFLTKIASHSMVDQKQALGQKVYTLIKKWTLPRPVKVSPVLIHLLDHEDFSSLGHLTAEYPSALREKVILVGDSLAAA